MLSKKTLFLAGILTLVLLSFYQVCYHPFSNIDDNIYITYNLIVRHGVSLKALLWSFTTLYYGNWAPVTWISHLLDYDLYGTWAGGHHITSLLLHSLSTILLFHVLHRITGALGRSAFVALCFGIHPVSVEPVAWISSRKDVLAGLFLMLSLLAYLRYCERPILQRYLLFALCFALGLMSKSALVPLPLVLLLLDYWPLRALSGTRPVRVIIIEKIAVMPLSLLFAYLTRVAQLGMGAMEAELSVPFWEKLGKSCYYIISYVHRTIWPAGIALPYGNPQLDADERLFFVLVVGALSLAALFCVRRVPFLTVGWFWFLIMILPYAQILQVGLQVMSDRWAYTPQIGLFIMISWGGYALLSRLKVRSRMIAAASVVLSLALALLCHLQVGLWQSSVQLVSRAHRLFPDDSLAWMYYGMALLTKEDLPGALEAQLESFKRKPASGPLQKIVELSKKLGREKESLTIIEEVSANPPPGTHKLMLSMIYAVLGTDKSIIEEFKNRTGQDPRDLSLKLVEEVLAEDPEDPSALNAKGVTLFTLGRPAEAQPFLEQAVKRNRYSWGVHQNLGQALFEQGKLEEALRVWSRAAYLGPGVLELYLGKAKTFVSIDRLDLALAILDEVLDISPDLPQAWNIKGTIMLQKNNPVAAIALFRKSLELSEKNRGAINGLGTAYFHVGDYESARNTFEKAVKTDPEYAVAHLNLASVLIKLGQFERAKEELKTAASLDPNLKQAREMLAGFHE